MKNNNSKIATATAAITGIVTAYNFGKDMKERWDDRRFYSATVKENSYVFPALMEWINRQTDGRYVMFKSDYHGIKKLHDSGSDTHVNIKGHRLSLHVEKPDMDSANAYIDSDAFTRRAVFRSTTRKGIEALHELLEELTKEARKETREVQVSNPSNFDDWTSAPLAYRNIESVFLPEGVKESVVADLDKFIENEDKYRSIGAPWHRGYLLYGEPGNGKSSLVAALAHRYKFNLYNLPLSGVKNDKQLAELVSRISSNSMLLLEDIDIFSKSIERKQSGKGPTLAGLLNALDGVSTPHGLLTFVTTNKKEKLDPALIRPGRIDFALELKAPDTYQIESMFEYVYNESLSVPHRGIESMAELTNIFKRNLDDPEGARLEIKE